MSQQTCRFDAYNGAAELMKTLLFWLILALLFTGLIASDEPLKGSKNISANSIAVLKSNPVATHDENHNSYGYRPIIKNTSIYLSSLLTIYLLGSKLYQLDGTYCLFTSRSMAFLKAYQVTAVAVTTISVNPK
jgi:hypothetical protein